MATSMPTHSIEGEILTIKEVADYLKVRSDETKGEGSKPGTFGSQTIEYDSYSAELIGYVEIIGREA